MGRGEVSYAEWELMGPLLPPERGRRARAAGDNRRFLTGKFHVLRVGCSLRDMYERCGKWNSVYVPALSRTRPLGCSPANAGRPGADRRLAAQDRQDQCSWPPLGSGWKRGGNQERSWSITRRLYEQDLRTIRQSGTAFRLHANRQAARPPITPQPSR